MTDEQVLKYLKIDILQDSNNITLVHSSKKKFSQEGKSWLNEEDWKVSQFNSMVGSETEILVAFTEDPYASMEVFSRAKKQLIIVTK